MIKFDNYTCRELMVGYVNIRTSPDEFDGVLTSDVPISDVLIVSKDLLVAYLREATDKDRLVLADWLEG